MSTTTSRTADATESERESQPKAVADHSRAVLLFFGFVLLLLVRDMLLFFFSFFFRLKGLGCVSVLLVVSWKVSVYVEKKVPGEQVASFKLRHNQVEVFYQEKCTLSSFLFFLSSKRWQKFWSGKSFTLLFNFLKNRFLWCFFC